MNWEEGINRQETLIENMSMKLQSVYSHIQKGCIGDEMMKWTRSFLYDVTLILGPGAVKGIESLRTA